MARIWYDGLETVSSSAFEVRVAILDLVVGCKLLDLRDEGQAGFAEFLGGGSERVSLCVVEGDIDRRDVMG